VSAPLIQIRLPGTGAGDGAAAINIAPQRNAGAIFKSRLRSFMNASPPWFVNAPLDKKTAASYASREFGNCAPIAREVQRGCERSNEEKLKVMRCDSDAIERFSALKVKMLCDDLLSEKLHKSARHMSATRASRIDLGFYFWKPQSVGWTRTVST